MEKNSDKSHGLTDMSPHRFGRFLPLVTHLPNENSILSNFSSPRGVAILGCEYHSQAGSARTPPIFGKPTPWPKKVTDMTPKKAFLRHTHKKYILQKKNKDRLLVTGCAGFIGMHLCQSLLEDGFIVNGIDLSLIHI